MLENNHKEKIYWLMDQYLSNKIDGWTFSDEYYKYYDLAENLDLTPLESQLFAELSIIANRFTNIEEDLLKYPGTYFTEDQLRQKIIAVKKALS